MYIDAGRWRRWPGYLLLLTLCACAGNPAQKSEAIPHGDYRVGYAVYDLAPAGKDNKPLTVAVWYPTAAAPQHIIYGGPTGGEVAVDAKPLPRPGGYPLLVFSHGYGGSGLGAVFLGEYEHFLEENIPFES